MSCAVSVPCTWVIIRGIIGYHRRHAAYLLLCFGSWSNMCRWSCSMGSSYDFLRMFRSWHGTRALGRSLFFMGLTWLPSMWRTPSQESSIGHKQVGDKHQRRFQWYYRLPREYAGFQWPFYLPSFCSSVSVSCGELLEPPSKVWWVWFLCLYPAFGLSTDSLLFMLATHHDWHGLTK